MTFSECTVHCHTSLCDGRNTPAEMAAAAFAQGVKVLGLNMEIYHALPLMPVRDRIHAVIVVPTFAPMMI